MAFGGNHVPTGVVFEADFGRIPAQVENGCSIDPEIRFFHFIAVVVIPCRNARQGNKRQLEIHFGEGHPRFAR
jgi:hypothetical protein